MFSNFIYFISVLLIYATYQPAAETNFTPIDTGLLFAALHVLFIAYNLSLIHISEPTRRACRSRMPSSA